MTATALRAAATGEKPKEQRTILQLLNDPRIGVGLAAVAGKYMTKERLLRLCVNAVKKTPRLMDCDPQTVLGAMMTSCALGLEPNTVQQQAFLIPYKRRAKVGNDWIDVYDCQFQIGARGYVTLAYRSEHIQNLDAAAIHDGDHFKHRRGTSAFLEYETSLKDRGPLIGAFSYVRMTSGAESSVVLPLDELMKIRARSETYRALVRNLESAQSDKDREKAERNLAETPWVMWEDDMATKSAIKKHAKNLPIAAGDAFAVAAGVDEQGETGVLDLGAMVDPDRARAAMADVDDVPVLEHAPSEALVSTEAFGATGRQAEAVARGGQQQAQQQVSQGPSPSPAPRPAAKRATAKAPAPAAEASPPPAGARGALPPEQLEAWKRDVTGSPTKDDAAQALDLARSELNDADMQAVTKAFHERWGD
jgi:phage RecT family recombinase